MTLQEILENALGSSNVYFQPPPTLKMKYPCIVYRRGEIGFRTNLSTAYSNDRLYALKKTYTVTIIDPDPDSKIPDRIQELEYCSFARAFTQDNLNHDVYILYY